ncbi:hypothetical protein AVEN_74406-1 [Araneus ventricosus]|uniref:Uncharacterized protein n=1 Tax=Araneus ventricosus TaxID=182803 RepID=A0A4Y2J6K0_ARAVE|nr:hypothetical protein AVEN_74406-1 [Araneus ventricosus]
MASAPDDLWLVHHLYRGSNKVVFCGAMVLKVFDWNTIVIRDKSRFCQNVSDCGDLVRRRLLESFCSELYDVYTAERFQNNDLDEDFAF